jgi:plastocyanin
MMRTASIATLMLVAGFAASGCDSSDPVTPGPTPPPDPAAAARTITITASGATPRQLTVAVGTRVLFVNNDSRPHSMNSDPHPEHTDCTELNQVGFLNPGQTKETGNLNTPRTCGFHDHDNPFTASLQGRIVVQ